MGFFFFFGMNSTTKVTAHSKVADCCDVVKCDSQIQQLLKVAKGQGLMVCCENDSLAEAILNEKEGFKPGGCLTESQLVPELNHGESNRSLHGSTL